MVSCRLASCFPGGWLSMETMIELTKALSELERLVCPVCHAKLCAGDNSVLCTGCSRRYPLVDGIPVLLANRAV
jgi:uncharacterized protein YbaR (Trm112 family)